MRFSPALVAAGVLALAAPAQAGKQDKRLDIIWVDVEGGGATLIVTPAGESILVDTGNPGGRDAPRIEKAVRDAGLARIDHLVITHHHVDHYGGAAELLEKIPVGTLYENGLDSAPEKERTDPRLEPYKNAKFTQRVRVRPGQEIRLRRAPGAAAVRLRVLGTRGQFAPVRGARKNDALCAEAKDKGPDASDNRNSVVLLLEHGPFRFFDGGDLTWQNEATLVCPLDRVGPVDVYQTNHHGLSSSNNPVLVRTLDPIVTVMNNGPRKGSHPETFVTLKALPRQQALYQVHRNVREGVGETNTEDAALIANRDESCKGESVYLSVAPDGRNYTVRVPSTGHERTYETRRAVAVAGGSSR